MTCRYKKTVFILAFLCVISFFSICVYGEENMTLPDELSEARDKLPEESEELLPNSMFADDLSELADGIDEFLNPRNIFTVIKNTFSFYSKEGIRLFATLLGIVIISSLISSLGKVVENDSLTGVFGICRVGVVFCSILEVLKLHIYDVVEYFERLNSLMLCMVPALGATLAMGGNINSAATGSSTLYGFITVSEGICAVSVMPICVTVTALGLVSGISPDMKLGRISGAIKKGYSIFLGFIMTVMLTILSATTEVASAADGVASKTAKLAASTFIPVVGGSVGETLRAVAASAGYIKSVVGVSGIVFLVSLLLPTLISLIVCRMVFMIVSTVADMIGSDAEAGFIGELGNVFACLIAVVAMTSVMFIIALYIFVKISVV